jgi:hypothetical protein
VGLRFAFCVADRYCRGIYPAGAICSLQPENLASEVDMFLELTGLELEADKPVRIQQLSPGACCQLEWDETEVRRSTYTRSPSFVEHRHHTTAALNHAPRSSRITS